MRTAHNKAHVCSLHAQVQRACEETHYSSTSVLRISFYLYMWQTDATVSVDVVPPYSHVGTERTRQFIEVTRAAAWWAITHCIHVLHVAEYCSSHCSMKTCLIPNKSGETGTPLSCIIEKGPFSLESWADAGWHMGSTSQLPNTCSSYGLQHKTVHTVAKPMKSAFDVHEVEKVRYLKMLLSYAGDS